MKITKYTKKIYRKYLNHGVHGEHGAFYYKNIEYLGVLCVLCGSIKIFYKA
jgi:hypothetical protein